MLTNENIEDLKRRVDNLKWRGPDEKKTRRRLINRTLRFLGWDDSDEEQVEDEYPIPGLQNDSKGRVDYALLTEDGNPAVFVEAKRLGNLGNNAVEQLKEYGLKEIIKKGTGRLAFLVLTDGNVWEFHLLSPEKGLDHYKDWYHTLNIETDDTSEIRDTLNDLLARQNVLSGDFSKCFKKLFLRRRIKEIWEPIASRLDEIHVGLVEEKMTEMGYESDREEIEKVILGSGEEVDDDDDDDDDDDGGGDGGGGPGGWSRGLRVEYGEKTFQGHNAIYVLGDALNLIAKRCGIDKVHEACAGRRGRKRIPLVMEEKEAREISIMRYGGSVPIYSATRELGEFSGYRYYYHMSNRDKANRLTLLAMELGISEEVKVYLNGELIVHRW